MNELQEWHKFLNAYVKAFKNHTYEKRWALPDGRFVLLICEEMPGHDGFYTCVNGYTPPVDKTYYYAAQIKENDGQLYAPIETALLEIKMAGMR